MSTNTGSWVWIPVSRDVGQITFIVFSVTISVDKKFLTCRPSH